MSTQESNVINAAKAWHKTYGGVKLIALRGRAKSLFEMVTQLREAEARDKLHANEYVVIRWVKPGQGQIWPIAKKRKELTNLPAFEVVWGYGASTAKRALKAYAEVVAKQIVSFARKAPKVDTKRLAKRRGRPRKEASPGDWPE